jgi:acetyl/propionyl-CoA carboxylase alpha subunit
MVTYKVVQGEPGYGFNAEAPTWVVIVKESGVIVAGPFDTKGAALADANLRASAAPGNRVES